MADTDNNTQAHDPTEEREPLQLGKLMRIGELARRSGKTVRALHIYEELSLLQPAQRTDGGFRLYHPSSVERVAWIGKLQEAGFSLGAVQELLRDVLHEPVAPDAMARLRAVFAEKLEETRAARARLERLEKDLSSALTYLEGCRGCPPSNHLQECPECQINGHSGKQPALVAGIHHS
jgi:MerR family transcriptional regulator, copper efflux regulator